MMRDRDPLKLGAQWHVDLRLEAELPEDTVIGTRFLVQLACGAVAFVALLYTGWLGFVSLSLRYQIRDWERRIADNHAEVREIQRMQQEFAIEAAKIDQAHALIKPQFAVSELIADLGRTRPDLVSIHLVEWNDIGIVIRGSLRERSERASRLLGGYVEELRRDEKIGPRFREIVLTDLDRGAGGDLLRFEIVMRQKEGA